MKYEEGEIKRPAIRSDFAGAIASNIEHADAWVRG